ncbi:SMI1/KNR4 family protein [Oceanobacillus sp. Castelsardo]|uniref:SMI1/KNR4 family protein n=1 Tax=Oceanobacillus sp. Castelsardo TaxID=1851204 RepID=UPI000837B6F3|nr:SMI1/KNR4 family protein [Oceanobacillus sp. Castelsardo]
MKKSFWQEDDEYKVEPITNEIVAEAEKELSVKLPESYISLLKEQNGGYISYDSYPTNFPTSWADDHINVDYIRGIGGEESILESEYLIKEWGLPKKVVLISGDGHTWIAFDYRNTDENPPIILIDHDGEEITELAPDFESFLNGLTKLED